jgi:hypothetical protein
MLFNFQQIVRRIKMNKKIKFLFATACMAVSLTVAAEAGDIQIKAHKECRFESYGGDIGSKGRPTKENDYMTGFIGLDEKYGNVEQEYRTVWQFKLDELKFTVGDVVSATVTWTPTVIWAGNTLAIDQVKSDFTTWNTIGMYDEPLTTIATELGNSKEQPDPGIDITKEFKEALANATDTSGLALRFYVVGSAGDFNGGGIRDVHIKVVTAAAAAGKSIPEKK